MKLFNLFIALVLGANCSAQNPVGAIEPANLTILYRGFQNKLTPAVTNKDNREIGLIGTNASVKKAKNNDYFIVNPKSRNKTETLYVVLYDGESVDTIRSVEYKVKNLPVPNFYWGEIKSGGVGNIEAKKLSIDYPVEVPLDCDQRIISWETSFEDETISGNGNDLSSAQDFFKNLPAATTLVFTIKVISSDGITRIRKAQWEVQP